LSPTLSVCHFSFFSNSRLIPKPPSLCQQKDRPRFSIFSLFFLLLAMNFPPFGPFPSGISTFSCRGYQIYFELSLFISSDGFSCFAAPQQKGMVSWFPPLRGANTPRVNITFILNPLPLFCPFAVVFLLFLHNYLVLFHLVPEPPPEERCHSMFFVSVPRASPTLVFTEC